MTALKLHEMNFKLAHSFINRSEIRWISQPINSVLGGAWKSLMYFLSSIITMFCSHFVHIKGYIYIYISWWLDEMGLLKWHDNRIQSLAFKFIGIQAMECWASFTGSTNYFCCNSTDYIKTSRNTTIQQQNHGCQYSHIHKANPLNGHHSDYSEVAVIMGELKGTFSVGGDLSWTQNQKWFLSFLAFTLQPIDVSFLLLSEFEI